MSLCDPYTELELYLKQVQDELTDFFKTSPQENLSNYDSEAETYLSILNVIGTDLSELLERSKKLPKYAKHLETLKNDKQVDQLDESNGVVNGDIQLNGTSNYFTNTEEVDSTSENELINIEDIVEELNGSQTTINSGITSLNEYALPLNNIGIQTSPTISHSSSLTRASDYCSSPCLTFDQDAIVEDIRSSSSSMDYMEFAQPQSNSCSYNWTCRQRWLPPGVVAGCSDLGNKSSSAPVLKKASSKVNKQSRSQSDRHLAEIEATEACKWLRAAGFPQYAQLYEELKFPMDITSVQQDHKFLEADLLHSLYRRLRILNQCARMHQLRTTQTDDSEDEQCALSGNWTYLPDSGRWSRVGNGQQNLPFPTSDECSAKDWWSASLLHSKPGVESEKAPSTPGVTSKGTVRRYGSLRPHRRRDGVVISDSGSSNVLDILAIQVKDVSPMNMSHVSDSECQSTSGSHHRSSHRRRMCSRSLDKAGTGGDWSPKHSMDRMSWHSIKCHTLPRSGGLELNAEFNGAASVVEGSSAGSDNDDGITYPMESFSCGQLQVLRKLALLKLTSFMERYCPSHRSGWNWELPKFIRKIKAPAYRDKQIFGVPLAINQQRTGQTLPKGIQIAIEWLRGQIDQVGLFRKPGVKSRIQALKTIADSQNVSIDFNEQQPYDVADLVKLYFRELPEPLLTNKLSETLILIFQLEVSQFLRRQALLCTLLLLPDEHCEVLHVLLDFLHFVAEHSAVNQMNETNLALCFAPSLFQMSPTASSKQSAGRPGHRELAENKAAQECLGYMITHCDDLFNVPKDLLSQCRFNDMDQSIAVHFSKLGEDQNQDWRGYQNACQSALLKESRDRSRGWVTQASFHPRVELAYKKVADGHPLRLWRVSTEIDAAPPDVMHRILKERHLWDEDLYSSRIVVQLDDDAEIFQYVRSSMASLMLKDFCVLRTWNSNLPKGSCSIVETSVEYPEALCNSKAVRGIVLASRYLIEPCGSGRSRLLHIARVEMKGKMLEWYHKSFGHISALMVSNIQNSFKQKVASGQESKVY